jgi:hypothetical protein
MRRLDTQLGEYRVAGSLVEDGRTDGSGGPA